MSLAACYFLRILWPLLVYEVPISTVETFREDGQKPPEEMGWAAKEP